MRVQTEEWRRFIPGVRMYKGKKTLFYNGEILFDYHSNECLVYDEIEQNSWEVIIVLPGVEVIPSFTFGSCGKIEAVIMSDSVRGIGNDAFDSCSNLVFVRLSRNLEYIQESAFRRCISLVSMYIPASCREIDDYAFLYCTKLIILSVSRHTQLGESVIGNTALMKASPFTTDEFGFSTNSDEVNDWIRNLHADTQFSLHLACSSDNPSDELIFDMVKREGLQAFQRPDIVGVTASQYLSHNPFTEIKEQNIVKRYILDMMGEVI